MLRERTATILNLLVDEYVSYATPVASEAIARRASIKVSPATVRSEMANLEDMGYIIRSHVSAGGVPADKAYRFYLESNPEEKEPPWQTKRRIMTEFAQVARNMEGWTHQAAVVLAQLADNMAIVTVPRAAATRFKYLQLVHLQEFMALLVVVLQEARLQQQLLPLAEPTTQQHLTEMAHRLNEAFSGLTYPEIKAKELPLNSLEEAVMEDTMAILRNVESQKAAQYFVDGLRLLFNKPEFAQGHRAKVVVEMLEEPALVHSLLSKVTDEEGLGVFIGEENQEEALRPFGVVLCHYGVPQQASGVLGVVGPTRMEYPTVLGRVKFLSSFLSGLISEVHRPG